MPHRHILLLIACNMCWGFNFVAGKIGTDIFSPLLFSALRFGFVLALLLPFLRWAPGQMRLVLTIGLALGAGHYPIMFYAIHKGNVLSMVAIASQLVVPISTLLAVFLLGERIKLVRSLAIALCFIGVVIIGFEAVGPEDLLALTLAALAALAMAVATILMRQVQGIGVFNMQAWIALIATPVIAVLALSIEQPSWTDLSSVPLGEYWSPFYSAVGATIFGHGMMYWLLQRHPVNQVTPFITLSTVFAVIFGVWLFNDELTLQILLGGTMTLVGVFVISRRAKPTNI